MSNTKSRQVWGRKSIRFCCTSICSSPYSILAMAIKWQKQSQVILRNLAISDKRKKWVAIALFRTQTDGGWRRGIEQHDKVELYANEKQSKLVATNRRKRWEDWLICLPFIPAQTSPTPLAIKWNTISPFLVYMYSYLPAPPAAASLKCLISPKQNSKLFPPFHFSTLSTFKP